MEEKSAGASAQQSVAEQKSSAASAEQAISTTPAESVATTPEPKASNEHRQAYGTAKTENLQDSGLWRLALPTFVVLLCIGLLAVPLIILIPLLINSFNANAAANLAHISLTWVWILMIVIEMAIAAVIIRGLIKIFMTQAGNYRR